MVVEVEFLTEPEWWKFDRRLVDQVAFPLGDRYPQEIIDRYFAVYGGLVHKFRPRHMLEIGVRFGYTGIVCCAAALAAGVERFEYLGIDDESYHAGSCQQANDNFRIVGFHARCRALRWNSFDGIPAKLGTFDLIHVDGNHDKHGVLNDLMNVWPILHQRGFVILDDYYFPQIREAIDQWLEEFVDSDNVVAVQFVEDERGHAIIRKTGLRREELQDQEGLVMEALTL